MQGGIWEADTKMNVFPRKLLELGHSHLFISLGQTSLWFCYLGLYLLILKHFTSWTVSALLAEEWKDLLFYFQVLFICFFHQTCCSQNRAFVQHSTVWCLAIAKLLSAQRHNPSSRKASKKAKEVKRHFMTAIQTLVWTAGNEAATMEDEKKSSVCNQIWQNMAEISRLLHLITNFFANVALHDLVMLQLLLSGNVCKTTFCNLF